MLTLRSRQGTVLLVTTLLCSMAPGNEALADAFNPEQRVRCSKSRCGVTASVERQRRSQGRPTGIDSSPGYVRPADARVDRAAPAVPDLSALGKKRIEYWSGGCHSVIPVSGLSQVDCYPSSPKETKGGVSAGELGWRAVERLDVPSPVIRLSPSESAVQVVGVPSWLWLDREGWGPVSETARVPGLSVTARAVPRRVVWSMGDGGRVVCEGPGTPYSVEFGAGAESPDCGYTYSRSSVDRPGGVYRVSASVSWDVMWEGGGESGRVPGLVTVDEVPVVVDEIQAVVVNQPGR